MHSIQAAADRTGLSPDVIRIWERRYQAVMPERTASNQRLYSDEDVYRLSLLKRLTDLGRRISAVAPLSTEQLLEAVTAETPIVAGGFGQAASAAANMPVWVDEAMGAIVQLDPIALDKVLHAAVVQLGMVGFLTRVIHPLMTKVGELWRKGEVRTCQEHFASAHVRSFIGKYILDANGDPSGPRMVVATPPGHLHELGATMAAVTAAMAGWNVIYLGPNVPYEEIIFAADCKDARVVALSLSYPADDPKLPAFLKQLDHQLSADVVKVVGGASVECYSETLESINAHRVADLDSFSLLLDRLRIDTP